MNTHHTAGQTPNLMNAGALPRMVSIGEACDELNKKVKDLGMNYHRLLNWIRKDKYDLGKNSQKVGWGWIVNGDHLANVVEALKAEKRK